MSLILHVHEIIKLESYLHQSEYEKQWNDVDGADFHRNRKECKEGKENHQCESDNLFAHFIFVFFLLERINFRIVSHKLTHHPHQVNYCKDEYPYDVDIMPI